MSEPSVTINGQFLTEVQAITVRCAIEGFASLLTEEGLGDDAHGKAMVAGYLQRISEIREMIFRGRP